MSLSKMNMVKASIPTRSSISEGKKFSNFATFMFCSKLPRMVAALLPASAKMLVEKAWNAYPHCRTGSVKFKTYS